MAERRSTPRAPSTSATSSGACSPSTGVILTGMGIFGDQELDKTGDINANLWAGLGLLVVGVAFLAWARIRPIVVPEHVATAEDDGQADPSSDGAVSRGRSPRRR